MEPRKKARLSLFAVSLVGAASIAAPATTAYAGSGSSNSFSNRNDCQLQGWEQSYGVPGASHGNFIEGSNCFI
jgi:hypothetical protein